MADFNSHIITNAGRNLLARALAGEGKVLFTKAAFGDQKHSGNLREVTELKNKKLDLNVMNIRNDNGTAVLTVQISNQNVDQSFQTEEFGVYAKIEGDATEILYSYTTAVSADTFPNNRLGKTYESIQDIYMAISSDVEAEIYVRDGVIYLTRDIANQVYTETGLIPVGELKGRSNLEANKQYLAANGHWYKNIGGDRTWDGNDSPDENLIPVTWEELSKQIGKSNSSIRNEIVEAEERVIGKSYGGILNEAGQKYEGKTYWDKNTKKLFLCKRNNTDISANINNYIAIDSNSLLDRLENLYSVREYINWFSNQKFNKISCICYSIFTLKIMVIAVISEYNNADLEIIFPETFNKTPFVAVVDNDTMAKSPAYEVNIDWASKTKIKIKTGMSSFTLLAIG